MDTSSSRQAFHFTFTIFFVALFSYTPLAFIPHLDVPVFYNSKEATLPLVLFIIGITVILFFLLRSTFPPAFLFSFALVIGGAASNITYRLLIGPVPDYIPLPLRAYSNLADALIFLGILIFLALSLRLVIVEGWFSAREENG